MRGLISIFTLLFIASCTNRANKAETLSSQRIATIDSAISYFTKTYPEGQLADLYKSFYQDAFGPGHLLGDTSTAREYLRWELEDTTVWEGPLIEKTGTGENFYRVNMSVIRDSVVPEDVYFSAFLNSLERTAQPDSATWVKQWSEIDSILTAENITFPNEEADRAMISEKLATANFAVHHSRRFNSVYKYHYRIISIPVFEEMIRPYLLTD